MRARHPLPKPDPEKAAAYDAPSKSQVKRDLQDLQALAVELLELPDATLDALIADERLRDAFDELRRVSAHSARKRQIQYVGKLLRHEDIAPLQDALASRRAGAMRDKRVHHEAERWRERLLADDAALAEWTALAGTAQLDALRASLRDARREIAAGSRGTGFRQLFRRIHEALLANSG